MSALRKGATLYQKAEVQNRFIFQSPPFEEWTDLGKSLTFFEAHFLVNGMDNPASNLTQM
jgi:hypothetical protein